MLPFKKNMNYEIREKNRQRKSRKENKEAIYASSDKVSKNWMLPEFEHLTLEHKSAVNKKFNSSK